VARTTDNGQVKEYVLFRIAEFLSRCSTRRFAYWLGLRIGDFYFRLDHAGRAAVLQNLRQVHAFQGEAIAEPELRLQARRVFQNFGKYLVDFFRFARLSEEQIRDLVRIEHPEYLEQARQLGRGVVLVSGHLGNWELGGAVLAGMGYTVNAVALKQPSQRVNDFFSKYRRRRGLRILPLGGALRGLVAALHRQECVALLADRDYSTVNHPCRLFGQPTDLPRGPAWLACKTGAPVVAAFRVREPDDTFSFRVHPPLVPNDGITQDEIQDRVCRILEQEICARPTQWFVFQPLWNGVKLRPVTGG
jgi:KDO2-lipid IV(A) lauroyltransferase